MEVYSDVTGAWVNLLRDIMKYGNTVNPRGSETRELLHKSTAFRMVYPVVDCDDRKLSYKFLAGEALWILAGDNRVDTIEPYNKVISNFSDDGETFFGAYGPQIDAQLGYVVNSLVNDPDTRQAVMTIWQQNPQPTKDFPCTVALTFNIRNGKLNCHAFMRSSDAWLGFVYDMFNFTMIACRILWLYVQATQDDEVILGDMYWTGVSSHLYEPHFEKAKWLIDNENFNVHEQEPVPDSFTSSRTWWADMVHSLRVCRDNLPEKPLWRIRNAPND